MKAITLRGPRGPAGPPGAPGANGDGSRIPVRFTGDGETATFTLPASVAPGSEGAVVVTRNGLVILPVENAGDRTTWDEYWVDGNQLMFGAAPRLGNVIGVTIPG